MSSYQHRGRVKRSELIDGLTPQQQAFVQAYKQTGNRTYAARNAYAVKNDNVAVVIASENLRKPAVAAAMQDYFAQKRAEAKAEREAVLRNIYVETEIAKLRGDLDAVIKGTVKMGKLLGMFKK